MCWHLFTWGTAVRVVAPPELQVAMEEMAAEVSAHHRQSVARLGDQDEAPILIDSPREQWR